MRETKPPSFGIGIPTINQWPLLKSFLPMYERDFPDISISVIDNGNQGITGHDQHGNTLDNVEIMQENIGVAASWNLLCKKIFSDGHSHAIISNDDIYWKPPDLQWLKGFVEGNPRDLYKTQRDDWSLFIIPKTTFEKIGLFDKVFFPAYFEDRDYMRRMRLAGCSCHASLKFDPMIYNESLSSKKDPSLRDNFEKNKQRYINKWGGPVGQEKFTVPFGAKQRK